MIGGSTFLGELFNQNKDAFIWFEPLDAIYSYMYGTAYGWHPPDIFHDEELQLRYVWKMLVIVYCIIIKSVYMISAYGYRSMQYWEEEELNMLTVYTTFSWTHTFFSVIRTVI